MGYLYSSVCLVMIFSFLNSSNKSLFYEKFKAIVVVKLHENMNLYSPKNTPACLLHFIFIIELRAIFVSQIDRSIRNCLPSTLYHKTRITKNQRNEQFSELIHLPTFRKHYSHRWYNIIQLSSSPQDLSIFDENHYKPQEILHNFLSVCSFHFQVN